MRKPGKQEQVYEMRAVLVVLMVSTLAGCGGSRGPASTDTSSASFATVAERVEFLQRYVTFRRGYRELDFHIVYRNGGGGAVPGPSEWDVSIVAVVPHGELASWVRAGVTALASADRAWLAVVPGGERAARITEWYVGPGSVVGIDRVGSVVAYRRWSL
jgi:hypothetical protein